MTAVILDGRATAKAMRDEIAQSVSQFQSEHGYVPGISVVLVGADPASAAYVKQIEKSFTTAGMRFALHSLPETADAQALTGLLAALNADPNTHGIIVQMPLPAHLPQTLVTDLLDPRKDVDGISPVNAGRLFQGDPNAFSPATPAGGLELLRRYNIPLKGRRAVVVGRSNIVGRPMAMLLLHEHATVTICHSRTANLGAVTREGEILVAAIGKAGMIAADMIRPGAVVVDFGVNVIDGRMLGDVDTEAAKEVSSFITPVPGGTGPMTNVMLMSNTLAAARRQL